MSRNVERPSYDPYQVEIPEYDSSNPEMVRITEADPSGWAQINDPDKRFFYVEHGDYTAYNGNGVIRLSASGSENKPRYLVYYSNPANETHPINMTTGRAIIRQLIIQSASYWIIDRLTIESSPTANQIEGNWRDGSGGTIPAGRFISSHDNILNRLLIENIDQQEYLKIYEGCNDNTIQYCVIRGTRDLLNDNCVGVLLQAIHGRTGRAEIRGTRIIANEMYNLVDGVGLFDHNTLLTIDPSYPGTVIADNDLYITSDFYTDGSGNYTTSGSWSIAENAIDIKAGSRDAYSWVHIVNNRMWGFRYMDVNAANKGSGANGEAMVIHNGYSVDRHTTPLGYILIKNNVIMDATNGLEITKFQYVSVWNNVFYDITKKGAGTTAGPSSTLIMGGNYNEYYMNTIIDSDEWIRSITSPDLIWDIRDNLLVSVLANVYQSSSTNVIADYNFYYGCNFSHLGKPGTHDIEGSAASNSGNSNLQVTIKKITGPETVTIHYGKTESASPHYGKGDPNLGSRKGVGVDNSRL